jgi:multiple sugar transport system substrate-binding protein
VHYDVKIKAANLLLENVDDTFVTPVFNGSASLRDAAGQLIEKTVISVRRSQQVDDAFYRELYEDVQSQYHLDQLSSQGGAMSIGKADLGPLPGTAVALLASLACAWVLIALYVGFRFRSENVSSE